MKGGKLENAGYYQFYFKKSGLLGAQIQHMVKLMAGYSYHMSMVVVFKTFIWYFKLEKSLERHIIQSAGKSKNSDFSLNVFTAEGKVKQSPDDQTPGPYVRWDVQNKKVSE